MRQISGVVVSDFARDAKFGTEKRCAHFGEQFFGCVCLVTKPLAQFPVQSARMRSRMNFFMSESGAIRLCIAEALLW